ncbi:endonuclease/exonuclease/phosphatase [Stackebrandtia nassauensis]|uniref:Endonuclease/exonuclease/phosphatase n=1 Tax=Stackebrandtia nassauensis (strain DSM 44728 / CIP 108903 / NRRL B-16338 / NBRC 102104 / LLR-40K-21) TaxID=446470 RepID=D3QC12_STANL|nr:endonuclease/exonuclease/phosphatase [Stackebrandtia nassauensis]ADD44901.1 Endonuclease/exonuclease/phosphatase [Stackebrandtia nassauensis DSM 44728]
MSRKLGWRIALGAVALATGLAFTPLAFADDGVASANDDPSFLQVYDANVENLPEAGDTCPGDWQDLVYYMKTQDAAPDLYLIQQLSGSGDQRGDLQYLIARMEKEFGQNYDGILAQNNPGKGPQKCAPQKGYQTNGIIFRVDRFEKVKTDNNTWLAQSKSSGSCRNSDQDRTRGVKIKLRDKLANKTVTAASVHWPTAASDGPPCADVNAKETAKEMTEDGYGADQLILGGDMNYTDAGSNGGTDFRSWYKAMNGDLKGGYGFRDAVYAACAAASDPNKCRASNWTVGGKSRIDFLMAKTGAGKMPVIDGVRSPTFDEGDAAALKFEGKDDGKLNYSDHRAVQARVHY